MKSNQAQINKLEAEIASINKKMANPNFSSGSSDPADSRLDHVGAGFTGAVVNLMFKEIPNG